MGLIARLKWPVATDSLDQCLRSLRCHVLFVLERCQKELYASYVSGYDCLVLRSQVADRQLARIWLTILDPSARVPESRSLIAEHGKTMVLPRNFGLVPSMSRVIPLGREMP